MYNFSNTRISRPITAWWPVELIGSDYGIKADDIDKTIAKERFKTYDIQPGPKVGDWLRFANGSMRRFTHDWGESIQIGPQDGDCGSYYLSPGGYASYSGALDPSVPKDKIKPTGEFRMGRFWFFHHDYAQAHSGITIKAPCRIYKTDIESPEKI